MVIHPSGQISQVEEGGGWSEWSGRFPNASRNEESEDQNIEKSVARNAFILIKTGCVSRVQHTVASQLCLEAQNSCFLQYLVCVNGLFLVKFET